MDKLLLSLYKNLETYTFEIFLVHNCKSNYQVKINNTSQFKVIEVFNPAIKSLSQNLNKTLQKTKAQYTLIINPDTYLPSLNIKKNLEFLIKNSHDLVSCPSIHPNGKLLVNLRKFPNPFQLLSDRLFSSNKRYLEQKNIANSQSKKNFWFQGSYLLGTKKIFNKVRFQEKYFLYFEDVQFCYDSWIKGFSLGYNHNTQYFHYFQQNSARYLKYKLYHIRSYLLYFFSF